MSEIVSVSLRAIDANPFRRLGDYPFVERKLEALVRSFGDVGMWEGVIGRQVGNRYQIAFGHHRVEAARRSGLKSVPLIVRELSDEEMLQFMGRENMEDYNADFLTMLETWEAAVEYAGGRRQTAQVVDIARLLGWTEPKRSSDQMNDTARACSSAHELLAGSYIKREALEGLSVRAARDICGQARSMMTRLDRAAKTGGHSAEHAEGAKKKVGKAAERTAKEYLDPKIANVTNKNLRGRVEVTAYRAAKDAKRQLPIFEQAGIKLANVLENMLAEDASAAKLEEIAGLVNELSGESEIKTIERIRHELKGVGRRAESWRKRLIANKVADLKVAWSEEQ